MPLGFALIAALLVLALRRLPTSDDSWAWFPFTATVALFCLAFVGLAYSFYPYVVPDQMTIYEAAAAPESLAIILAGTVFVLPIILGYTALAYTIFRESLSQAFFRAVPRPVRPYQPLQRPPGERSSPIDVAQRLSARFAA